MLSRLCTYANHPHTLINRSIRVTGFDMCKTTYADDVVGTSVRTAKVWSISGAVIPYHEFPATGATYHGEYSATYSGAACTYM